MEHSTFQGKLIPSGTDAAVMKVHSKEKPPDIRMRLTKVFMLGKETTQQKAVFQVIIADGCLFYGNDALRSRGGCCICLLMASGLIAKRFSIWLADASEGEITHTTFSKRLKSAVFIILPRLVYTSHLCGQSNMDDIIGGHEKTTTKDVLTFAVRYLSRLHVDKTNGQEICWKQSPSDWPEKSLGPWKNPTSSTKDSTKLLWRKYDYLRPQVLNKLNQEELKVFEDFNPDKIESVKSFMWYKMFTDTINKIKDHLSDMQEPHLMLLKEDFKSLLSSITSRSKDPTAADTSSLPTLSRKRKLSNTCIDSSECTTSSNQTETAAATNDQPLIVTSPSGIMNPLPGSSHEEPSRTVSPCIPTLSVDSGTCSQESNINETVNELDQQKLNDNNVQDNFQFTRNSQNNNFDGFQINADCLRSFDDFLKYFEEDR